jgi:hypothetical protein
MKNLVNEVLLALEERFKYTRIETQREYKQTPYFDIEYVDTSDTRRCVTVTPSEAHSFIEICLYHFRSQQDAEKYVKKKSEDESAVNKDELAPVISLWYYTKEEDGKHETVIFDTTISPNARISMPVSELIEYIENAFVSHEKKELELSEIRRN